MAINKLSGLFRKGNWQKQENLTVALQRIAPCICEKTEIATPNEYLPIPKEAPKENSFEQKTESFEHSFGYPSVFKSQSRQTSYSVKLKIIENSKIYYTLCPCCPSGRPIKKFARIAVVGKHETRIEHQLLASNHISALFGCSNINRCEGSIVKVVF